MLVAGTGYVLFDNVFVGKDQQWGKLSGIELEAARWAKENIPSDRLCAMYDPGIFSYFSRLNTVALNGLVSNEQNMLDSLHHRFNAIVKRMHADYLIVYLEEKQVASIPENGLLYKAGRVPGGLPKEGRWLCIVDAEKYTPFKQ